MQSLHAGRSEARRSEGLHFLEMLPHRLRPRALPVQYAAGFCSCGQHTRRPHWSGRTSHLSQGLRSGDLLSSSPPGLTTPSQRNWACRSIGPGTRGQNASRSVGGSLDTGFPVSDAPRRTARPSTTQNSTGAKTAAV